MRSHPPEHRPHAIKIFCLGLCVSLQFGAAVWRSWVSPAKANHVCLSVDASRVGKQNTFVSFLTLLGCGTGWWGPPQVPRELSQTPHLCTGMHLTNQG